MNNIDSNTVGKNQMHGHDGEDYIWQNMGILVDHKQNMRQKYD